MIFVFTSGGTIDDVIVVGDEPKYTIIDADNWEQDGEGPTECPVCQEDAVITKGGIELAKGVVMCAAHECINCGARSDDDFRTLIRQWAFANQKGMDVTYYPTLEAMNNAQSNGS